MEYDATFIEFEPYDQFKFGKMYKIYPYLCNASSRAIIIEYDLRNHCAVNHVCDLQNFCERSSYAENLNQM